MQVAGAYRPTADVSGEQRAALAALTHSLLGEVRAEAAGAPAAAAAAGGGGGGLALGSSLALVALLDLEHRWEQGLGRRFEGVGEETIASRCGH